MVHLGNLQFDIWGEIIWSNRDRVLATWGSTAFGPHNFQKSHPFHSNTYKVTKMNSIRNKSSGLICDCVFNRHIANFPLNTCIRKLIQPNMPQALMMYLSSAPFIIRMTSEYCSKNTILKMCQLSCVRYALCLYLVISTFLYSASSFRKYIHSPEQKNAFLPPPPPTKKNGQWNSRFDSHFRTKNT